MRPLSIIALCGLAGLAGCMSPYQQQQQATLKMLHGVEAICPAYSTAVPGHYHEYWDCGRDNTADATDAGVSFYMAQQAQFAEDADAGKITDAQYHVASTNLRMQRQAQVQAQQAADRQQQNQNTAAASIGVLGLLGAAVDIAFLAR